MLLAGSAGEFVAEFSPAKIRIATVTLHRIDVADAVSRRRAGEHFIVRDDELVAAGPDPLLDRRREVHRRDADRAAALLGAALLDRLGAGVDGRLHADR